MTAIAKSSSLAWLFLFVVVVGASRLEAQVPNPQFTLLLRGPCGETIEGAPGSQLDDGTGGAPDFENGRAGMVFDVVLRREGSTARDQGSPVWTWSLGVEGPLTITDVTLEGSVVCLRGQAPQCEAEGRIWAFTTLTGLPFGVGPQTEENHGAVSVVAIDTEGAVLWRDGEWVLAKIRVTADFPPREGETVSGRLFFVERVGDSGPIAPDVNYGWGRPITPTDGNPPLQLEDCEITLRAVAPTPATLKRCDTDADGELRITDAVATLHALFAGGPPAECPEAADCNDSGEVDIADAIYTLEYLFNRGPAPPEPFPDCGEVEGLSVEDCPTGSTACS